MKGSREYVLEAEGLCRSYHRGAEMVHALADLSLAVSSGEMVGLVGRSGSGKSTFLNLAGCMDVPTAGRLWIRGQEVTGLAERELVQIRKRHVGFVFQLYHLIPTLTALENVMLPLLFGHHGEETDARELCARVGLDGKLHVRPGSLSGGDRQRVAIARALVNRPDLLLADEPTGRLESRARDAILELFDELRGAGLAIILATHDLEQAAHCDRIVRLSNGRVVQAA